MLDREKNEDVDVKSNNKIIIIIKDEETRMFKKKDYKMEKN